MRNVVAGLNNRWWYVAWTITCASIWIMVARDQATIAFCALATIPYSLLQWREYQYKDTSPAQIVAAIFSFLSLLELGMFLFVLAAVQTSYMNHQSAAWILNTSGILAVAYWLAWFSASAYADGYKTLGFVRAVTTIFLIFWVLWMMVFYFGPADDHRMTYPEFIWLTSLPSILVIVALLFSKQLLIRQEGAAV